MPPAVIARTATAAPTIRRNTDRAASAAIVPRTAAVAMPASTIRPSAVTAECTIARHPTTWVEIAATRSRITATAELRSLTLVAAARSPPSVTTGSRSRIIPHRAAVTVAGAAAGRAAEELRVVPAVAVRTAAALHTVVTKHSVEENPSPHPRRLLRSLLFRMDFRPPQLLLQIRVISRSYTVSRRVIPVWKLR